MSDVLDQAQNFAGGPVAAARKRESWLRKAANTSNEETAAQYREAAADLAERYPEIATLEPGQAEGFARQRGHGTGARSPVQHGRSRTGTTGSAARTGKAPRPRTPRAGQGRPRDIPGITPGARRGPRQAGRPTPRIDRAIRQTGIPQALGSSGSLAMSGLGALIGLSLLFLLVNSAEKPGSGAAALPTLGKKVTGGLGRFLSLKDILPPGSEGSSHEGRPTYNEGPNSNIAKAAARLRAAERLPSAVRAAETAAALAHHHPRLGRQLDPHAEAIRNVTGGR